jgi:hypothetical protein
MLVEVNGAKLYVDVENSGLIPDGNRMSEKPTLLLLHGVLGSTTVASNLHFLP